MTTRDSYTGLSLAQLESRWKDTVRDIDILLRRREKLKNNYAVLIAAGYEVDLTELHDLNAQLSRVYANQTMYEDRLIENGAKGWVST